MSDVPGQRPSAVTVDEVADATIARLRRLAALGLVEHELGDSWRVTASRDAGFSAAQETIDAQTWAAVWDSDDVDCDRFDASDLTDQLESWT